MFYRIAITIAVVAVFLFAYTRNQENAAPPTPSTMPSDESGMKGLQIN